MSARVLRATKCGGGDYLLSSCLCSPSNTYLLPAFRRRGINCRVVSRGVAWPRLLLIVVRLCCPALPIKICSSFCAFRRNGLLLLGIFSALLRFITSYQLIIFTSWRQCGRSFILNNILYPRFSSFGKVMGDQCWRSCCTLSGGKRNNNMNTSKYVYS